MESRLFHSRWRGQTSFSLPEESSGQNYTRLANLNGSQASILVPSVGRELISRCPPSDRSRSSMLRSPMPFRVESLFTSNPFPRSTTDRWRSSPETSRWTSALFAPLCRLMFRSPSWVIRKRQSATSAGMPCGTFSCRKSTCTSFWSANSSQKAFTPATRPRLSNVEECNLCDKEWRSEPSSLI